MTAARNAGPEVQIFLKPHPAMDERAELALLNAEDAASVRLLPRSADLIQALAACNIVVGVNTIGSALVHAVDRGIPIVRLQHHPAFDSGPSIAMNTLASSQTAWHNFWSSVLFTVQDADELTEVFNRLGIDRGFSEALTARSLATADLLHPQDSDESLRAILDDLLT